MPMHQLGQLAGYKWISDWSNNMWQMGKSHPGQTPERCHLLKSCRVYTADPVTCYADPVTRYADPVTCYVDPVTCYAGYHVWA